MSLVTLKFTPEFVSSLQKLHALIVEKKMALERLRIECEALQKIEAEQNDFIDQLILQQ